MCSAEDRQHYIVCILSRALTLCVCCCVQLSYGLSSEYSKSPAAEKTDSEKVDADRQLYAKLLRLPDHADGRGGHP